MRGITPIDELKSLLLQDYRQQTERDFEKLRVKVLASIEKLEKEIYEPERLAVHISKSKSQLLDILAPEIGKLIKNYLALEIEKIQKRISDTTDKFSYNNVKSRFKALFGLESKERIDLLGFPEIIDILMIDKDSGLLLGKFSTEEKIDTDIVAGMFNAIKSFADTAFENEGNELDLIHYNDYKIKLHVFGSIYYATIFTGRYSPEFQDILNTDINNFTDKISKELINQQNKEQITSKMSQLMNKEFTHTCTRLERRLF